MNVQQSDAVKLRQLRNHKRMATGLFLLMVAIYAATTWLARSNPAHWIGYVRSFAEAAMVGALADWFAVTALFHHPLGIPIPHTNLIEKSKKSIGDNLGNFVVNNFLTPQNIRPYIQKLAVSAFVAEWLSREKNKQMLMAEAMKLLRDILHKLDDETMTAFIAKKGAELTASIQLNTLVANALQYFIDRKEHEKLITALAARVKDFIRENGTMVREKVRSESYFFVPKFVDRKLADKISGGLQRYFEEIEEDPNHKIREEIGLQLYRFIGDMRTQEKWVAEFAQLRAGLLSEEKMKQYAADIWQSVKGNLAEELSAPDSALQRYFSKMVDDLAHSLREDEILRNRIDNWIRHTAYKYILRNTENVGLIISNTVGNWQGRELSQKLEMEVGKDLQFIRINGTLVGGLVGLLIYAITHLLS